jgi:hypothetical protein
MRIKDDRDILIAALCSAMFGTEDVGGEIALCEKLLIEYNNGCAPTGHNRLVAALDSLPDDLYTKISNLNDS